jgi:hypothetical protein
MRVRKRVEERQHLGLGKASVVKELTIIGFCTSEAGATKLMNYAQSPGPFRGDVPLSEVGKASAL